VGAGWDPKAEPEGCWAGLAPKPPKVEPPKEEKWQFNFQFFLFYENFKKS
jgi:hypothetical protein